MTDLGAHTVARNPKETIPSRRVARYAVWLLIPGLVAIAAVISPAFLTPTNLLNVVRQSAVVGVAAVGLTFTVLIGGVDVSVAAVITAGATAAAAVMNGNDSNIILGMAAALAVGLSIGLVNGILADRGIQPFILTLGIGVLVLGATQLFTGGTALGVPAPWFRSVFNGRIGEVPVLALVFLATALAGVAVHRFSRFGRRVMLIGANPVAARLSGVRTSRYVIGAYVLSGLTASVAGLVLLARAGPPSNFTGMGLEFQALAAVILGGTSFAGGRGSVEGSVAGALAMGLAFNLVNIVGLPYSAQQIVQGATIVLIAAAYALARHEGKPA